MLKLVQSELVVPIDPMTTLKNPWRVTEPFIDFIKSKDFTKIRTLSYKHTFVRIHFQKYRHLKLSVISLRNANLV